MGHIHVCCPWFVTSVIHSNSISLGGRAGFMFLGRRGRVGYRCVQREALCCSRVIGLDVAISSHVSGVILSRLFG